MPRPAQLPEPNQPDSETSTLVVELARQLVAATDGSAGSRAATAVAAVHQRSEIACRTTAQEAAIASRVARETRISAGRRARRLPYLATTATAAAGYASWGAAELAALGAGTDGHLIATASTTALSAMALAALHVSYRDRIPARWHRRWWLAATGAAAWATTASAVGPASWPMTACLAAGAAAASAGWLRAHEVPTPPLANHPTVPEPTSTDEDLGEVLARRWAENISTPRGVVPAAMLANREDLPRAIRWTVQTKPGSAEFAELFGRRGRIAAGLRVPATKVILEPSNQDESWALLTVITKDLLAAGIPYPGPRYEAGRIPLGPFADGAGEAEYFAYDEVGCRNGMASGEPGSGKSAFLESVGLGLKSSGEWVVWFGDGDPEGGSSPVLNEIADWAAAGPQGVNAQLEALEAALEIRSLVKATLTAGPEGTPIPITNPATQRPIRELRPCPTLPGLKWIVDELHRLTSDPWLIERGFVQRLERLVRIGRKYGIVVLTGSQSLLAPDFGNSTTLRGYLAAKNLFAFRNQNRSETAVVSGLSIAPSTLPPGGGYAFATSAGRLSMMRVAWERDLGRYAPGLPATNLDLDTDLATAQFRPAEPRDPASVYSAQIGRLERWRASRQNGGTPIAGRNLSAASTTVLGGGLAGLRVPTALTADNVISIHRATADRAPVREDGDDTSPDLDVLSASQRTVYDALVEGIERTGEIAAKTQLKLPAVSKALAALADLALAEKLAHGRWSTTQPAQTG